MLKGHAVYNDAFKYRNKKLKPSIGLYSGGATGKVAANKMITLKYIPADEKRKSALHSKKTPSYGLK